MRLLWAVTALATIALAEELSSHEIIKKVLRSWDPNRQLKIFDHHEIKNRKFHDNENENQPHSLSKRSTFLSQNNSYISPSKACNTPGYTGEYCEFPICAETNENIIEKPETDDLGATIDGAVLANCTQKYVVLVDETMYWITFQLESEYRVNPRLSLQGEDGSIYTESKIIEKSSFRYEIRFDNLPPGQYSVISQADILSSSCHLTMRARTPLTIQGGFLLGEGYQTERSDYPNLKYTFYKQLAAVAVHASRNRSPGKLTAINFVGEDNAIYRPRLLTTRYNCSYEYIFESFYCKQEGYYYYQVEGITFQGYGFRRIFPFRCILDSRPTSPSIPSTTPAAISECQNGGVLVTKPDFSKFCYCQGLFGGLSCEKRLCSNGGTLDENNRCHCPPGYLGSHCQDVHCNDDAGFGFDAEHRTLTFVIHTKAQLNDVIKQVINATEVLVDDLAFDTDYIIKYILVLFNNNRILLSKSYVDIKEMKDDLITTMNSDTGLGGCTDMVFSSVAAALAQYPTNKSPVYVITDALPSDINEMETVFHLVSYTRSPLYFIYVEPLASTKCSTSIEDPGYRATDSIAKRSGGMIFYFKNRGVIQEFLFTYMKSTVYLSQLLLSNDEPICANQRLYKAVSVDTTSNQLVVVATGRNISLIVTDPDGQHPDVENIYSDGLNYIWVKNGPQSGNWLFTLFPSDNTEACNFKVFQKAYNHITARNLHSELFWAFTPAIDSDGSLMQPVYAVDQSIVMHLTNYFVKSTSDVHAGLTISANRNGQTKEVYASNGIWRSGCSYNIYFPPFTCQVPNEILYFNFYAQDKSDNIIQRAGVMSCAEYHPTPTPPQQCQNGGVMDQTNTSCFCPPGFNGKHCEKIVCYNGGTPQGVHCNCVPGWSGEFCEFAKCLQRDRNPQSLQDNVDMVFAVELTLQSHAQLRSLNQKIAETINDVTAMNPIWIERFILVGFNSTWGGVLSDGKSTTSLIHKIDELASILPTDSGCRVQTWRSLENAIREHNVKPGSFIQIFQTSPPDNDGRDLSEIYRYSRSQELTINAFLSYSLRNKNGYFCNATEGDFTTLYDLAAGSTGATYPIQPANTVDILRVIPLQYSSGIVYARSQSDCTIPIEAFFPIDAYTQTIQLSTIGNGTTVKLFDGNGKSYEISSLLHDPDSGWDIWEVRKPCDEGWELVDQYCFYFGVTELDFYGAQQFCHDANGQVVDDMTENKHEFLSGAASENFWLGLFRNKTGYEWDRPNNRIPEPLTQAKQYWAGNGIIPPEDPNKECVFWNASVTGEHPNSWTPGNCKTKRPFICQKHQYDPNNNNPNEIGTGDLPAGKWFVEISAKASCFVNVRVQSGLQIVSAFTTEVSQDAPLYDPIDDSTANRVTSFVRSLDNKHNSVILNHAMLWDVYNGTLYNAMTYSPRFGCTYPWISQPFNCPNSQQRNNEFGISHIGVDEFGNSFQRITFGHCGKPQIACGNGGIRSNGKCICTEYWTGVYCTVPICVNGGTLDIKKVSCNCPRGYVGPSCQFEECEPEIRTTFSPDWKTLVLLVETTVQNKPAVDALIANINQVITKALKNNRNWFHNYGLVTFDSNGVSSSNFQYRNVKDLTQGLTAAANSISDPGSCDMPIYTAIQSASASQYITSSNSEILLVTSASHSTTSDNQRRATKESLINSQAHLNYFYISNTACHKQFTNAEFIRLAYASGGNVLASDNSNFVKLLDAYLPTLYDSSVLSNPTSHTNFTCTDSKSWYIQVDKNTTSVYVTTTSRFGSLGAMNPLNLHVSPSLLYNVGETKIYRIDIEDLPGIYSLNLNSPEPCYVHVYSVGGAKVYTEFASTSKTDPKGSHADGNYFSPSNGGNNIATFHLYGAPDHKGMLQYVEIVDPNSAQLVLRSELYRREHCSFEYYSDPFECNSEFLVLLVYGMDETWQQFRREEATYCHSISNQTTTTPLPVTTTRTPTTTEPYRDLVFDVAFLIDVSKGAQETFNDTRNFILNLMSPYSVSQSGVRVALISVFGDPTVGAMPIAYFNTITSQTVLADYLTQVNEYSDYDNSGQELAYALSMTTNIDFIKTGYRNSIKNHIIIYVTDSTKFTDNPQQTAKQILKTHQYGIITVGYGSNISDKAALKDIAGGDNCSFYAGNAEDLNSRIEAIRKLILAADTNGVYCGMSTGLF